MADTLLSSYPELTLTHVLGHTSGNLVGKVAVSSLGGSGTPGGSATQLQYHTGSAFGGVAGSAVTAAGGLTLNNGSLFTNDPVLNLAQTWNASGVEFTGIKANYTNTLSASTSKLIDLQIDGVSRFSIEKPTANSTYLNLGNAVRIQQFNNSFYFRSVATGGDTAINCECINITGPGATSASPSVIFPSQYLGQLSANTLGLHYSTTPQAFQVYNTRTSAAIYERGVFDWITNPNVLTIGTQTLGGGTMPRPVDIVGSALTFNGSPIGGGLATISDTMPAVGPAGSFWWESDTGALHVSYSSTWVQTTPIPAALTRTNDTNVTLSLTGSTATSLLQPITMTLGWTGTLSPARGGTGLASYTAGDLIYASGATVLASLPAVAMGKVLTSDGVGFPPIWADPVAGALDADLTAIAALTGTGYAKRTAADTWILDTPAGGTPGGTAGQVQYNNTTFGGFGYYDGSATLRLANGTTSQSLQVYKTITAGTIAAPTAFERLAIEYAGGGWAINPQAETGPSGENFTIGGSNSILRLNGIYHMLMTAGTGRLYVASDSIKPVFDNSYNLGAAASRFQFLYLGAVAYSGLPAAAANIQGCRATVTDATVNTFLATVSAGSGSNVVPVFCDGAAWKVG